MKFKEGNLSILFKKKHLFKLFFAILYIYIYSNKQEIINKFQAVSKAKIAKIKVGLCVIGKKENRYIKEYVNHYINLGYNQIFLYDNNDLNDEKFEDVLQEEIKKKYVTIIDVRGQKAYHIPAYQDCYKNNSQNYDWLSFFDLDEFLEIRQNATNIQEFLGNERYEHCDSILVNFLFYSDNELIQYDDRPVQERFKSPLYGLKNNAIIKTIVKGGLKGNYWTIKPSPHTSFYNGTVCDSIGKVHPPGTWYVYPIDYQYAVLKHYYTKSAEEYVMKSARGEASSVTVWNKKRKLKRLKRYFDFNLRTEEKEKALKKYMNLTKK